MSRRSTIVDVAREAGVSVGTVSRFLNNSPRVSDGARLRIREAIDKVAYTPNSMAQGMRRQRSNVVGCLINDMSHPLNAEMLAGAVQRLGEQGYSAIVVDCGYAPMQEKDYFRLFTERNVDGLLATVSIEDDSDLQQAMLAAGMPIVLWERTIPNLFDSVVTDHGGGCYQAARHLIELGHRRIGLINASGAIWPGRERSIALRTAFADCGLPFHEDDIRSRSSAVAFGEEESLAMLMRPQRPTALIAGVNEMIGVLRSARQLGLSTPTDLSLIACGETALTTLIEPRLTTVRWDVAHIGARAADLLLERLSGQPSALRRILVPSEFIRRNSCTPPPDLSA